MGRTLRLSEGRFGRLVLAELAAGDRLEAQDDPVIVLQSRYDLVLFLNPGEAHESGGATRGLAPPAARGGALQPAREWLRSSFPAVFEPAQGQPFLQPNETITPRIRQLADALAVEVLNDRVLSPERLEFMLQELLFSIIETYFPRRRSAARLWSGSRFED